MCNQDTFSGYHPLVNFLYFALVLVFGMCFMHPVCLLISLGSATAYNIYLKGRKGLRFSLRCLLPMMLLAAVLNPAFNHEGVSILAYTPNGNPVTFESLVYGLAAAFMLASVVQWFSCYNEVMTSDKFVYLFGRIIPALSLVLSMTLRFVPKFNAQLKTVRTARTVRILDGFRVFRSSFGSSGRFGSSGIRADNEGLADKNRISGHVVPCSYFIYGYPVAGCNRPQGISRLDGVFIRTGDRRAGQQKSQSEEKRYNGTFSVHFLRSFRFGFAELRKI